MGTCVFKHSLQFHALLASLQRFSEFHVWKQVKQVKSTRYLVICSLELGSPHIFEVIS